MLFLWIVFVLFRWLSVVYVVFLHALTSLMYQQFLMNLSYSEGLQDTEHVI